MAVISIRYPHNSEDADGVWKHYSATCKVLVIPSEEYIKNHPEIIPEEEPDKVETLQKEVEALKEENKTLKNENRTLTATTRANSESVAFLEECIVEMAEVVYA